MPVGKEIRRRREAIQMSQQQLARLAGVNQTTICRIENGSRVPSLTTLNAIAKHLLCTAGELLDSSKEAS
jgi:transcriptional regulator with XRE-family HTH domain